MLSYLHNIKAPVKKLLAKDTELSWPLEFQKHFDKNQQIPLPSDVSSLHSFLWLVNHNVKLPTQYQSTSQKVVGKRHRTVMALRVSKTFRQNRINLELETTSNYNPSKNVIIAAEAFCHSGDTVISRIFADRTEKLSCMQPDN